MISLLNVRLHSPCIQTLFPKRESDENTTKTIDRVLIS